ncbi:M14 family zinc carboxypeptidase [Aliiglaciecola lipolytica]|uniref:Peptidase M14 domain-containing protein n=1 Tax=Aliiglaciecola lipolytica E3 TaxID=1127673 RepID=K6YUD4_9ALTE|nr:M14 family zinc carboxypeptidase [Aliiglaciecola lipolytica]GAC14895.1 hypothetical protein GLIP_2267 [Aliiglaciecola lipolytica E3]
MIPDNQVLDQLYKNARIDQLDKPHIFPQDVTDNINQTLSSDSLHFRRKVVGHSYLGQEITQLTIGHGDRAILFWSQMHGDEPTATAALIDLIHFLKQNIAEAWLQDILSKVTLHIVPMLNPDGAAKQTRENAQGIDINRDAAALQTPEGRVLKSLFDELKPEFAFNLHDQSKYYRIEHSLKPVEMAFLAPAGDLHESMPPHRCNAMKLIGAVLSDMAEELFGKVAKYSDGYSERAFGDLATSLGIACVLIESGSAFNDENRQQARRFNFFCLLHGMNHIAQSSYSEVGEFAYNSLPLNVENGLADLLIKGLNVETANANYCLDIAINKQTNKTALISELGDLRQLGGFEVLNAHNYSYCPGNTFEVVEPIDLNQETYISLLKSGYCRFGGDISLINRLIDWPVIKGIGEPEPAKFKQLGISPTWLMLFDGEVKAAVLEGTLITLN